MLLAISVSNSESLSDSTLDTERWRVALEISLLRNVEKGLKRSPTRPVPASGELSRPRWHFRLRAPTESA